MRSRRAAPLRRFATPVIGLLLPAALWAHHSFAQFDHDRTIELQGTMQSLEWQNPHSWIWIEVTSADGSVETWGGEFSGGPSSLPREGFFRNTVQPGDKIVLTLYPARDGGKSGSVAAIQLPNGKLIKFHPPPDVGPGASTTPSK